MKPESGLCASALITALMSGLISIAGAEVQARNLDVLDKSVRQIIGDEIAEGRILGAVVGVGLNGRTVYRQALGKKAVMPQTLPMTLDTIFDLASLTKVIATTAAVMQLVDAGQLSLAAPAAKYWPTFGNEGKASITVEQLLTHTSGLRADLDLAEQWSGERAALMLIEKERPRHEPGAQFVYSDINFIALAELIKRITGTRLDHYSKQHIFALLQLHDTAFHPSSTKRPRIAPTERVNGELRWGKVHDPTAYRMGGVAGHAGLFSTVDDLGRFAEMLLSNGISGNVRILSSASVERMTRDHLLSGDVHRGLGWDIASPYSSGMDKAFGGGSYGHTGYTGTSLWLQPATGTFLIILTNRLHPHGTGDVKLLRERLSLTVAEFVK